MDALDWVDQLDEGDGLPIGDELDELIRSRTAAMKSLTYRVQKLPREEVFIQHRTGKLYFASDVDGAAVREALAFLEDCIRRLKPHLPRAVGRAA